MKKVLMVSSECFPYARTGGLSEVIPSLSDELNRSSKGARAEIILPFYRDVPQNAPKKFAIKPSNYKSTIKLGENDYEGELLETFSAKGTKIYFVKNDYFFKRDELYQDKHGDYKDNAERFFFFSQFVINAIIDGAIDTDIIHVHDWHASLVPAIIKSSYKEKIEQQKRLKNIRTVLTIHNVGYQGILSSDICGWANFDLNYFPENVFGKLGENHTRLNFLQTGIYFADKITTVSPTYAKEIQDSRWGFGLEELLKKRSNDLTGIINGANYNIWNPEVDELIPANFSSSDLRGKEICKKALSEYFGLEYEQNTPIIGVVARLSYQKGLDLLTSVWSEFSALNMKFVILGDGDSSLETFFLAQAKQNLHKVGTKIEFDVALSHLIQSGSDMFLMPSRYEPCGLTQIHAMKYGTIPIVRKTGGLKDTVKDFDEENQTGTGFVFDEINPESMLNAIKRAIYFYDNKNIWAKIVSSAMLQDFSYSNVSDEYLKMYNSIT